jgi:hypothetical protein
MKKISKSKQNENQEETGFEPVTAIIGGQNEIPELDSAVTSSSQRRQNPRGETVVATIP